MFLPISLSPKTNSLRIRVAGGEGGGNCSCTAFFEDSSGGVKTITQQIDAATPILIPGPSRGTRTIRNMFIQNIGSRSVRLNVEWAEGAGQGQQPLIQNLALEPNDLLTPRGVFSRGSFKTLTEYFIDSDNQPIVIKGDKGDKGDDGLTPNLTIGTVQTVSAIAPASASIDGEMPNLSLNLAIPRGFNGLRGDKGDKGDDGLTPNLTIGTVETVEATSSASASIDGTMPNLSLNLVLPRGAKGDRGNDGLTTNLTIGTVETVEAASSASASINGTMPNLSLNLAIPRGAKGDRGDTGPVAPVLSSINSLKASSVPADGYTVAVRSYVAGANDGGGGIFVWNALDSRADNSGTIIAITGQQGNGRWNRLFSGTTVNAEWFGGYSAIDNAPFINAAIAYAASIGGATVILPNGTLMCSTINMRSNVYLRGGMESTVITAIRNLNADLITWPVTAFINRTGLSNMNLEGNKGNNTSGSAINLYQGIYPSTGSVDSEICFENLRIQSFAGDGIFIDGDGTQTNPASGQPFFYNLRAIRFDKVIVGYCNGRGINANRLTDSNFVTCIFKGSQKEGIYLTNCSNLNLTNVKSFWNCRDGSSPYGGTTLINCPRTTIVAGEAQEEFTNGYWFLQCAEMGLFGPRADANGPSTSASSNVALGNGFTFSGCSNVMGYVSCNTFTGGPRAIQSRGVYIDAGGLSNSILAIVAVNQAIANYQNDGQANSGNLIVTVNGQQTSNRLSVRATNTSSAWSQTDGGTGSDALCNFDNAPSVSNGASGYRFNRNTSTTGPAYMQLCRTDGSSAVNIQFGFNGNTWLNSLAGLVGIGTSPTSSGSKLQILGGIYVSSGTPPATAIANGSMQLDGSITAGGSLIAPTHRINGVTTYTELTHVDSASDGLFNLNVYPVSTGGAGNFRYNRAVDTKGVFSAFQIFAANGTSTLNTQFACTGNSFINAASGSLGIGGSPNGSGPKLQLLGGMYVGASSLPGTAVASGSVQLEGSIIAPTHRINGVTTYTELTHVDSVSDGLFNLNVYPVSTGGAGNFRFNRLVDTKGVFSAFQIFAANGTSSLNTQFACAGNSFINGNGGLVGVGLVPNASGATLQTTSLYVGTAAAVAPGTGNIACSGYVRSGSFTVATLPSASVAGQGARTFASNGRKVGQGAGSGTGTPVYSDGTGWYVHSTDTLVAA